MSSNIQRHISINNQDSIAEGHEIRVHIELLESQSRIHSRQNYVSARLTRGPNEQFQWGLTAVPCSIVIVAAVMSLEDSGCTEPEPKARTL